MGDFFHMTCEAKGNLWYRARTTTVTIALAAGGYLVMSGTTAEPAAAQSSNVADREGQWIAIPESSNVVDKEGKLFATPETSNVARKAGTLITPGASSNKASKEGKLTAPSANAAGKEGKLNAAGASNNAVAKEGKLIQAPPSTTRADTGAHYVETYSEAKTADRTEESKAETKEAKAATKSKGDDKEDLFRPGPQYDQSYNADNNVNIYGAKSSVETPRPLLEVGRQQYTSGDYSQESSLFGEKNLLIPGLSIFGDWRTAVAYNNNAGKDIAQIATRLNLDVDFKLTATERIHAFFTPIQDNARFTRCEFAGGDADKKCTLEFDPTPQTLFFEGDFGSIYSGLSGKESSFDLPFTVGLFPLFLQNGIWANDAILGGAVSLTAKNSQKLGLSNYDITFFGAFDNVDNQSTKANVAARNNNIANLYGVTTFIDAFGGYIEAGYGLIERRDEQAGEYTNFLTAAYTRRYYNTISNSTRFFGNFGNAKNDDGFAIISENSLISGLPSTLLPYANFFVGFGAPQPLVDGNNAGILKNVGINFETDALTNFPKLNDTGSNAYGGAIGLQYLFNLDQQIVFEVATVQPFGDTIAGVGVAHPQYGFGVRYQIPITQAWLFRADATYQINEGGEDSWGIRSEIRRKF